MNDHTRGEWEVLKYNPNYKIWNQYPFRIQKICKHQEEFDLKKRCYRKKCNEPLFESLSNGYINVNLNGRSIGKHRLIALQ